MAGSAVIGALRVSLGLDSAQFTTGVKKTGSAVDRLAKNVARIGAVVATGMAAATSAVSAAVVKVSNYADEMGKVSQAVGVSVETLSELRHSADMSGASFEALQTGLRKLSQTMGDALTTPTSEGARALEGLGISVKNTDGTLKTSEQILGEVADAYANLEDGALKTDSAMAIFGRSGTALIPMLNAGSHGLAQMAKEARNLGLVIGQDTFRAAEAFNDNLSRLRKVFQGVVIQVTAGVLPAFKNLSDRIVAAMTNGEMLQRVVAGISKVFNVMAGVVVIVFNNLDTLYRLFKIFIAAQVVHYFTALVGTFLTLARSIRTAGLVMAAFNAVTRLNIKAVVLIGGAIALATGKYEELESAIGSLFNRVKDLLPESLLESGSSFFDGIAIDTAGAADSMRTYVNTVKDANASLENTNSLAGRLQQISSSATSKMTDAWKGLRKVTTDTFDQIKRAGENLGQDLGGIFRGLIDGTMSWKDAALSAIRSVFSFLNSRSMANGGGGLFGGGFFGSIAQGLIGLKNGGEFTVPGAGGTDSQIAAFRATPGERVTVTRPGQSVGGVQEIRIVGSLVDDNGVIKAEIDQTVAMAAPGIANAGANKAIRSLAPGGSAAKGFQQAYGISPRGRRAS